MRILFDSTVIAAGHLDNVAMHKTGIYRYAENLARSLNAIDKVELTFFSAFDKDESVSWGKKLFEIPYLKNIPLFNEFHPLKVKLNQLSQKIKAGTRLQKLFLRVYRNCLTFIMKSYSSNNKSLDNYEVFFSPYHPIPKIIREKKDIICFTVIHDLIPLKYPELFKVNKKSFFDAIFKNIKPNHYFLALSESTKADICHYYSVDPNKIFIAHSAPQEDLFYPLEDKIVLKSTLEEYNIKGPYILSLATIEPRKNILFLVDAFIKLLNENPKLDLKLVLCGTKGWGFDSLFEKIESFKEHIIVTGFVKDEDLAALYSGATAFVYPSLYEGFGLPPLEAMKCGTPVIVSDRSSLPEVVGDAGLYVDLTNIDDLTCQMLKIVEDEALRKALKEKAFNQVAKFTWENNAKSIVEAFENCLEEIGR